MFASALENSYCAPGYLASETHHPSDTYDPTADISPPLSLTAHATIAQTVVPAFTIVACSPAR